MADLNIGVDATVWQNTRGYGRHARALLTHLVQRDTRNRYTFLLDSAEDLGAMPTRARLRHIATSRPTTQAASASGRRSLPDIWRMSRALSDPAYDLLLFPSVYSYVPVISRARKIVFIHDIIPEKFPHLTFPRRTTRWLWKVKSALGRRQADALVTVSEFSRQAISEQFHLDPSRVYVVGEASDPIFRRLESSDPPQQLQDLALQANTRQVLYVGGFGPHKNLEILIRAFEQVTARDGYGDVRLILVGEYRREVFHSEYTNLCDLIAALRLDDRVLFTGYLADDELVRLLNQGTVLVLPSLMEGFGLPAVEAAACGCPVIATQCSPLPDLLGEACLSIDPHKQDDLEQALSQVLGSESLRERLRAAGLEAVKSLTWEQAADQMIEVIAKVANT